MERSFHMLLYRAFNGQRGYLRPRLRALGLGPGQPKLVEYLTAHGPCPQRELAEYFEIDPAAVSRMLDTPEKGGFVLRRTDQGNRRRDLVELTPAGQAAGAAWRAYCAEMERMMLRGFSAEERAQLADYLTRIAGNFRTGQAEGGERP